ncbi:MAG: CinA family protein, partial [Coxiellaceae bacterium]|nr:CinA family protein [Coxiellaceae bacterium]
YVTYSNEAKHEVLGVSMDTLEDHGAVSEQTAKEMAKGALENSHADIALSVTGVAGPGGGSPEKPVGTVWFGLADRSGRVEARLGQFTSGRKNVRSSSIEFGLAWLLEVLR